ncbi:MAG TPA: hypothetical protein VEK57_16720 [Thermoanaerobaculia bacterium]|nr:hypothetical protein [Thermoanaerobaculia bacterium]
MLAQNLRNTFLIGAFLAACSTSRVVHPGGGSASQEPPGGVARQKRRSSSSSVWVEFGMKPEEVVAVFRYTLDRRLSGNRAPLTFGAHSDLYSEQYPETLPTTAAQRREALTAILNDALSRPEVRVVSARQLLEWVRDPVALGNETAGSSASQ